MTVYITHNGETLSMTEWARKLRIPHSRISRRYKKYYPDTNKILQVQDERKLKVIKPRKRKKAVAPYPDRIEYNGYSLSQSQWAKKIGVSRQAFNQKLNQHYPDLDKVFGGYFAQELREATDLESAIEILKNARVVFVQSVILQYKRGMQLSSKQIQGLINLSESQKRSISRGFTGIDHGKSQEQWEQEVLDAKLPKYLINLGKDTIALHNKRYVFKDVASLLSEYNMEIRKNITGDSSLDYEYIVSTEDLEMFFRNLSSVLVWFYAQTGKELGV